MPAHCYNRYRSLAPSLTRVCVTLATFRFFCSVTFVQAAHRVNQLEQEQERKKAAAAAALAAKQAAELEAQEQAQQVQEQEPLGDDDASSVEKENCQRVDKQYTAEQRRADGSLVTLAQ